MRRPVPTLARCEPTIKRESRYWARASRGLFSVDDLEQEAWIVALDVLLVYDPNRMTDVDAPLTIAIRRRFQAMVRRALTHAFVTNPVRRAKFVVDLFDRERVNPVGALTARVLLARVAALPPASKALAVVLMHEDGSILRVAAHYHWTLREARRRVHALRIEILKEMHHDQNPLGRQ